MIDQGLELRSSWRRREFIPFDEMLALSEQGVTLQDGRVRALDPAQHAMVERALGAPAPSGSLTRDAASFGEYVAGQWSPTRAARSLLSIAVVANATDIHLESERASVMIRLRVIGEMIDLQRLEPDRGRRLLAALKHLAGCQPYRADIVQEGRIPRDGVSADVRASFLPTVLGERAALRLFGKLRSFQELGFEGAAAVGLERVLVESSSGLVLIAGPSGAGKTTTLYAALMFLADKRGGAHLSIEDPVEQRLRLAGVAVDQVDLEPERGLTAEVALVAALRQDIDVLSVGELRTPAQAELALQAAHTGRLVLAGIHSGSAPEAVQRMLDLGADRLVLQATLRAVLHQRLEARACPDCVGERCARCGGLGRWRVPCLEWVEGVPPGGALGA